jgi:autotransporter-associated beta strand protein
LAAVFPSRTTAAIIVWADIGTDFATGANWINSLVPLNNINTDIASFDTVATQNAPVLAANRRINGLRFTASGNLTFSGAGSLLLGASGINNSSTDGTKTIATSLSLGAAQSFTNAGALTVSGAVAFNDPLGPVTLTLTGTGNTGSLSGVVSGNGGLTKTGTGTWTLSGASTFTGATIVRAGTLAVTALANGGTASPLGSSTNVAANLVLNGGTLSYTGATQSTNRLFTLGTASGTIDASGSGPLTFSNAGSIAIPSINASRTLTLTGTNTGANTLTPILADPTGTGVTSLVKTGTGTWILSGANTFTGATTISAGTLKLGAPGNANNTPLGNFAAGTTVSSGAALDLNGFTLGSAEALTLNGTGVSGNGALTNSSASAATYSGLITLDSASSIVAATGDISVSNPVTITGAGFALTLGGVGLSSSVASIIDNTSGGVVKNGTGTWTLTGVNTYTGPTVVNAGILSVNGTSLPDSSAVTVAAPGILRLTAAETIGSLAGTGNVRLSSFTLNAGGDNTSTTFSGLLNGTGALTKAGTGTLTLSGSSPYTGPTTISAGTVQLGATGTATNTPLGTAAAGTSVTFGAALDLNGFSLATAEALTLEGDGVAFGGALTNSSSTAATYAGLLTLGFSSSIVAGNGDILLTNAGTITGAGFGLTLGGTATGSTLASILGTTTGTLTKSGTGTWLLSGANTFRGATTISAGTLKLGSTSALGTAAGATSVTSGAALDLNGFTLGTAEALTLNGTGVSGNGALTNSSASAATYRGLVTLGSAATIESATGDISVTNAGTITGAGFALTLDGVGLSSSVASIIGNASGGVVKNGTGTWTLTGVNTYTGPTVVNAGTLAVNGTSLPDSSAVTVAAPGTLRLTAAETIGSLAGAGTVTLSSFTLNAGGDNTSTTFSGLLIGTGALTKAGTGTWLLSGANTFTGATTVTAGTLRLGAVNALGTTAQPLTLSGGTLDLATSTSVNAYNTVVSGDATLRSNRATAGAGVTHTLGTLALGAHTLALATGDNVSSGTAAVTFGATTLSDSATLSPATGTTLTLGAIGDGGAGHTLTKTGAGELTFSAANPFTGPLVLSAGTLTVNESNTTTFLSTAVGTTLSVGATKTLTLNQTGNATLAGALAGAGNFALTGGGTASLSGGGGMTGSLSASGGSTYQVAAANGLPTSANLTLAASTLALGGFNQTLGTLTLGAGVSTLDFGSSTAALVFAPISGQTWSGSLSITNYTFGSDTLRFGADSSTVTSGYLAAITFANFSAAGAAVVSGGFVVPAGSAIPEPGTYAALLGLLSFLLAVRRRTCARRAPGAPSRAL